MQGSEEVAAAARQIHLKVAKIPVVHPRFCGACWRCSLANLSLGWIASKFVFSWQLQRAERQDHYDLGHQG